MEKNGPELPTQQELAQLPRDRIVAYAVRNALRIFPFVAYIEPEKKRKETIVAVTASIGWAAVYSVTPENNPIKSTFAKAAHVASKAARIAYNDEVARIAYNYAAANAANHAAQTAANASYEAIYYDDTYAQNVVVANDAITAANAAANAAANYEFQNIFIEAAISDYNFLKQNKNVINLYKNVHNVNIDIEPINKASSNLFLQLIEWNMRWIYDEIYSRCSSGNIDSDFIKILEDNAPQFCKTESTGTKKPFINIDPANKTKTKYLPPDFASLSSDCKSEIDCLGFDQYVRSFAKVIVLKETPLPLSIALFGNWGSGKSSFMAQLQKQVDIYTKAPNTKEDSQKYMNKIIHINFNAWHYIDSNIWASLATGIFEGIAESQIQGDEKSLESKRRDLQKKLSSTKDAMAYAEETKNDYEKKLKLAKCANIANKLYESLIRLNGVDKDSEVKDVFNNVLEINLKKIIWKNFKALIITFFIVSSIIACLYLAPCIKDAVSNVTKKIMSTIAILFPFIASMTISKDRIKSIMELNNIKNEAAIIFDETKSMIDSKKKIDEEIKKGVQDVEIYKKRIGELNDALTNLSSGSLIYDHINNCAANPVYGDNLSLIATIRKDFENLKKILDTYLCNSSSDGCNFRIVVYIDDLDRCPPDKVVEVLQAVHMFLAFEYFVVIVGVDPRWLEGSLNDIYLGDNKKIAIQIKNKDFSPQNYLEKIFQITFNIPAMRNNYKTLVHELVDVEKENQETGILAASGLSASSDVISESQTGIPKGKQPVINNSDNTGKTPTAPISSKTENQSIIIADKLKIQERDMLDCMEPLLKTPRLLKRLLNIYRIIRNVVPAEEFDDFIANDYKLAILLLTISVGFPKTGCLLLSELLYIKEEFLKDHDIVDIIKSINHTKKTEPVGKEIEAEKEELVSALSEIMNSSEGKKNGIDKNMLLNNYHKLKKYAPEIQRFSYQSEFV
jgi:hypothetical protein